MEGQSQDHARSRAEGEAVSHGELQGGHEDRGDLQHDVGEGAARRHELRGEEPGHELREEHRGAGAADGVPARGELPEGGAPVEDTELHARRGEEPPRNIRLNCGRTSYR